MPKDPIQRFNETCSCGRFGHKWGEWRRNYREGGFTRYCEDCHKFQRRFTDPNEVPFRGERW